MTTKRSDKFVALLSQLPKTVWEAAVSQAHSCKWLKPYSQAWPFGPFAALYVLLGLNNYQTRGRAEVGYWPRVMPLIPRKPVPMHPRDLREMLLPFFKTERMGDQKVNRLTRFTESSLTERIWKSNAAKVAAEFPDLWRQLAISMGQKPETKTIAFAIKCLAYALLLAVETQFDFTAIPIPVDSRVSELSRRLGITTANSDAERALWEAALRTIRKSNSLVTMLHLDCVLWQIGTLSNTGIEKHLRSLGAGAGLAREISALLDGR